MAKKRVYDLAKELDVSNKDVLAVLEKAGMAAKSHSSSLEDEQVDLLMDKFKKGGRPAGAKAGEKTGAKAAEKPKRKTLRPSLMSSTYGTEPATDEVGVPMAPPAAKRVAVKKAEKKDTEAKKPRKTAVQEKPGMVKPKAIVKPKPKAKPKAEEQPEKKEKPQAPMVVRPKEEAPAPPQAVKPEEETVTQPAPETAEAQEQKAPQAFVKPAPVQAATPPAEEQEPEKAEAPAPEPQAPAVPPAPTEPEAPEPAPDITAPEEAVKPAAPEAKAPEEPPRHKKHKVKGQKPERPEVEAMEGIDRGAVIPTKLKDRLQSVKKAKTGPEVAPPHARKQPKWQGFKAAPKPRERGKQRQKQQQPVEEATAAVSRKRAIKIAEGLTVKDFAEKIGQKAGEVLKSLMSMGMMATINMVIDTDAATLVADTFGLKLEVVPVADEETMLEDKVDKDEDLSLRPPVVTIMGHVDHGKTSLLDAIRKTDVTGGEAGGITQHIGAYKVRLKDKDIVFLDTPGHEAFTAMRARGAHVTDIVVLVVAADDGVMPQTVEAINHAKAAGVPIIVAVNKIDKPEADQEKIKREMADHQLVPEEWGGDTIFVPVSAKQKIGLESLLEMILLQAEVMELKANPNKHGRGVIIEAKLDKGRGPVATVLVMNGTVRQGDIFVTGQHSGRIRILLNDKGKKEKSAGPSTPVEVIGLSGVPQAGDTFIVLDDEKRARHVAQSRMQRQREVDLAQTRKVTLDDLFSQIQQGAVKELNIIIKGDVQGSVEALAESLGKLTTDAVKLRVIHGSAGAITESDIMLASASNAIVIGFNVRPEPKATALAESEGVDVRLYNIIYNAIDEVRAAMEGLLEPTYKEKVLGRAEVRQTFSVPKVGTIAGSYVLDGSIARNCAGVRVLRDNVVVYQGRISSLKRFKEDAKEVQSGYECGIGIENFNDIKVGDVIEAYNIEEIAGKL